MQAAGTSRHPAAARHRQPGDPRLHPDPNQPPQPAGKAGMDPALKIAAAICVTGISAMSLLLLGSTVLGFFGIG